MAKKTKKVRRASKKTSNPLQSRIGLIIAAFVVLFLAFFLYSQHQKGVLGVSTSKPTFTVKNNGITYYTSPTIGVNLVWTSTNRGYYKVYQANNAAGSWHVVNGTRGLSATPHVDGSLPNYFKIFACASSASNDCDSSNVLYVAPTFKIKNAGLTPFGSSLVGVTLLWSDNPIKDASYKIHHKTSASGKWVSDAQTNSATGFTDYVNKSFPSYFEVIACTGSGTPSYSCVTSNTLYVAPTK